MPLNVTHRCMPLPGPSHSPPLILSVFPGIDLFGMAFESVGACVVRGPDPLFGGDIRAFVGPRRVFSGIIGGSPCQDFSDARRSAPTGEGMELLGEFVRIVEEAEPSWFILENTRRVPDVAPRGYSMQRFFLNARDCGCRQNRPRRFQFGSRDGVGIVLPAPVRMTGSPEPCCLASEGGKKGRRTWEDFCELQGLPRTFDLPNFTMNAAYRAVGNGVPLPMGRVLARAILDRAVTRGQRVCVCGCGRVPPAAAKHNSAACRKRMERSRKCDRAATTVAGPVA